MKNWYVVSGAPSSGKTTVINELKNRGYNILPETATYIIEQELHLGKNLEEIRKGDTKALQRKIIDLQVAWEKNINPKTLTFLDRGIPDIFAFYKFYNLSLDEYLLEVYRQSDYRKIFLFDVLPLKSNHVRIEKKKDLSILDILHEEAYQELGLSYQRVPIMKIEDRADFIINNLQEPIE